MKETVLLYNFTGGDRGLKLKQALLPLGFKLKAVEKKDFNKPVGLLAGVNGMEEYEDTEYDGPGFEEEMAVLANLSSGRVDAFIKALRKTGVGKINYKAVLTDTNKNWDSVKLFEEIKKEHEEMNRVQ